MGLRKFRGSFNFTGGLDAASVSAGGVPLLPNGIPLTNGRTFVVDSGHANASDSNPGTASRPLATLDAAVGKCTASNGDLILLAPGHAESISATATCALDVAGISVVGMGTGSLRPTFTFITSTAAKITVDAANVYIQNLLFVNNIDSQVIVLDVNAADCTVVGCEFREGSAKQFLTAVDVTGAGANACDRFRMTGCYIKSVAAGAARGVELGEVADSVVLEGNTIIGDFDDAGIHNPTGKVLTNLRLQANNVRNLQTGDHAIELVSACTGLCLGNFLAGDTALAILDPGSLFCIENYAASAIDLGGIIVPAIS